MSQIKYAPVPYKIAQELTKKHVPPTLCEGRTTFRVLATDYQTNPKTGENIPLGYVLYEKTNDSPGIENRAYLVTPQHHVAAYYREWKGRMYQCTREVYDYGWDTQPPTN